jgi:hypothetical protein
MWVEDASLSIEKEGPLKISYVVREPFDAGSTLQVAAVGTVFLSLIPCSFIIHA